MDESINATQAQHYHVKDAGKRGYSLRSGSDSNLRFHQKESFMHLISKIRGAGKNTLMNLHKNKKKLPHRRISYKEESDRSPSKRRGEGDKVFSLKVCASFHFLGGVTVSCSSME